MPTVPPERELRPASIEDRIETSRRIKAMFAPGPVLVPYEEWSAEINRLCQDNKKLTLANPPDLGPRLNPSHRRGDVQVIAIRPREITIDHLLRYQELFYREAYHDPSFTLDRSRLDLPRERLDDIKAALLRGEVNYPLVVCLPQRFTGAEFGFTEAELTRPGPALPQAPTLHRVLFDRLIRGRNIKVWQHTNPTVDDFLEQVRDLTLADLTRTDLRASAPSSDGASVLVFNEHGWLPYLQALYPTLPRPTVQPGYLDLSFVAWEQDPPADRLIPGASRGTRGEAVTIQGRSQLDAVTYRYPLITPSRYFALFSQHNAATGQHLDTSTWSWLFGMIDPKRFPAGPAVGGRWLAGGLGLCRGDPRGARSDGRLRGAR